MSLGHWAGCFIFSVCTGLWADIVCHFTASLYTVLSAAMQSKGSAAFTGRWESGVCVYLDNSNIFIEAQRLATTRNGNSVDQSVRRRIRVDFDNLMELCCANRKLVSALAAVCRSNPTPSAPAGPAAGPNHRLDLAALAPAVQLYFQDGLAPSTRRAPAVQRYFQDGLAPSTRRAYDSAMKKFAAFCEKFHVPDPFPVTEFLLCSFAASMADDGLAPQMVKSYLAAIRNTQLSLGLPDPREQSSLPVLKRVLAGISRSRLGRGQPSRVRLPVTAVLLRRIKHELERSAHPERRVLWGVCCTAFFGFFRLGELLCSSPSEFDPRLHLSWGDMAVDSPQAPTMVRF